MKTILFLHGFFASGSCIPAVALRNALELEKFRVLTPDLPMHPAEAIAFIRDFCQAEKPDLIVGNSCGSFYGQMIANELGIPALLGNPYFIMTEFLIPRKGAHQYKSVRQDGKQDFIIDDQLISEYHDIEQSQFRNTNPSMTDRIWGLFGEKDTLAHFEPMFREHYTNVFRFPGAHTPTAKEVTDYYIPLINRMMMQE